MENQMMHMHILLLSDKKRWMTDAHCDVGEPQMHYAEWKRSDMKDNTQTHSLYVKS